MVDRVGDQQDRAVPVVEHGEVRGEQHGQLGQFEVVPPVLADLLQAAYDVVPEVADHASGERRQAAREVARGVQGLDGGAQRVERVAVHGYADGRRTEPVRPAVAGGEGGGAAHADEGVPGPGAPVLGGLQEEGAGALGGELAVEADRGVAVREQPAADGDDTAVDGQLAEGLDVHGVGGLTARARAGGRRSRSRCGRRCGTRRRPDRPGPARCRRRSRARRT